MKKIVIAAALLTAPVLLTGCGNKKTLTCTQSQMGILDYEVKVTYKGDKVSGGEVTLKGDYSSLMSEEELKEIQKEDLCKEFENTDEDAEGFEKAFGKCTNKWDGGKFTLNIKLKKDLGGQDGYKTIDEAKESMEKEGFSCEIK